MNKKNSITNYDIKIVQFRKDILTMYLKKVDNSFIKEQRDCIKKKFDR